MDTRHGGSASSVTYARRLGRPPWWVAPLVIVGLAIVGFVFALGRETSSGRGHRVGTRAPSLTAYAAEQHRKTIYHSPQKPGYTAWVGAWVMPDGSLMTAFTQATGPTDPALRAHLPESTLEQDFGMTEETSKRSQYEYLDPRRDFFGLHQSIVYLRSTNDGKTWKKWRQDTFKALTQTAYSQQGDIALSDGTLIRRLKGRELLNYPTIPHGASIELLKFDRSNSGHQARNWSAPLPLHVDASVCSSGISRIRQLSDGRLIALGAVWGYQHGTSGPCASASSSVMMWVADSNSAAEAGDWTEAMPETNLVVPDEWDVAELPDGDLLALFRTEIAGQPARREAILRKTGATWVMQPPHPLPPLAAFKPSGHPDLLRTTSGLILSFATSGVAYTADGGQTWNALKFSGPTIPSPYRTDYYPRSIQAPDGTIFVFSERGGDDPYGTVNESIVVDQFRLVVSPSDAGKRR